MESHERDLVSRAKRGDVAAREELVDIFGPRVRTRIHWLVSSTPWWMTNTEDLCQEALLRLAKNWGKIDECGPFWPYLSKIALNVFRSWYKTQRQRNRIQTLGPEDEPIDPSLDRAKLVERNKEIRAALKRCLDKLPEIFGEVFRKHWIEEKPLVAVAGDLQITLDQAKHRSSDGRKMLAMCLKEFR